MSAPLPAHAMTAFANALAAEIRASSYRFAGEASVEATWARVARAHSARLKGCTVYRPNAVTGAVLSLPPTVERCCELQV